MATRFQSTTVNFDGSGTSTFSIDFLNTVRDAGAFIQGFDASFGSDTDHELRDLDIKVQNVKSNGTLVTGEVVFKLEDNTDNSGSGSVTVGAAADVEA